MKDSKNLSHYKAQDTLQAALDGTLSAVQQDDLDRHLEQCTDCRVYASGLKQFDSRLKSNLPAFWPARYSRTQEQTTITRIQEQERYLNMKSTFTGLTHNLAKLALAVFLLAILIWGIRNLLPPAPVPGAQNTPNPSPTSTIQIENTPEPSPTVTIQVKNTITPNPTAIIQLEVTSTIADLSGPPICPDLPRPAMLFNYEDTSEYTFRHASSGEECIMQFDPPVSQILALSANGVYYTTKIAENEDGTIEEQVVHYANDGEITRFPYLTIKGEPPYAYLSDFYFLASPDGSQIAWSQPKDDSLPEYGEEYIHELYLANTKDGTVQQLYQVSNVAWEPSTIQKIEPLRFTTDGHLLFSLQPSGKGGGRFSYTGRYRNLYQVPLSGGDASLIYECPEGDISDCIGDISEDNAYIVVTEKDAGQIAVFDLAGTRLTAYSGPGQGYIGSPDFSPAGDLVFVSADISPGDGFIIEQMYLSHVVSPHEQTEARTLLTVDWIDVAGWWVDNEHIVCHYPEAGQISIVDLQANIEPSISELDHFLGVLP